jgi:hypothetical protein
MFKMKVILPRQVLADPRRLQRVIENTLNQSALAVKADFGVTVQTWSDKPQFKIERKEGERVISTDNLIYFFINNGTRVRYATMTKDFQAKTRAGFIGSGGGRGGVAFVSKRRPKPGIKARKFDVVIKKKWDDKLPTRLQRAIDSEV